MRYTALGVDPPRLGDRPLADGAALRARRRAVAGAGLAADGVHAGHEDGVALRGHAHHAQLAVPRCVPLPGEGALRLALALDRRLCGAVLAALISM